MFDLWITHWSFPSIILSASCFEDKTRRRRSSGLSLVWRVITTFMDTVAKQKAQDLRTKRIKVKQLPEGLMTSAFFFLLGVSSVLSFCRWAAVWVRWGPRGDRCGPVWLPSRWELPTTTSEVSVNWSGSVKTALLMQMLTTATHVLQRNP